MSTHTISITSEELHHIREALTDYQLQLESDRHHATHKTPHLIQGYDRDIEETAAIRRRLRELRP